MLSLKRHEGQAIYIAHDIQVRVLEIGPKGEVRIGIVAPPSIRVDRKEAQRRVKRKETPR